MGSKWPLLALPTLLLLPSVRTMWTTAGETLQAAWSAVLGVTGTDAFVLNVVSV